METRDWTDCNLRAHSTSKVLKVQIDIYRDIYEGMTFENFIR